MKKNFTNLLINIFLIAATIAVIGLFAFAGILSYQSLKPSSSIPFETTSPYVLVYTDTYFNCEIVYDKDTKVMYSISNGTYNRGTPTVLLNADGTPKIWEGDE